MPTSAALQAVATDAFDAVLAPAGYSRLGKQLCWQRVVDGMTFLVGAPLNRGRRDPQWGMFAPELVTALWEDIPPMPPALNKCFVLSRPSKLSHPAKVQAFATGELDGDPAALTKAIKGLKEDLSPVVSWLEGFASRRDVWTYIAEHAAALPFVVPAKEGLALFTAALLAAVDGDAAALSLAARAREALRAHESSAIWSYRFSELDRLLGRER